MEEGTKEQPEENRTSKRKPEGLIIFNTLLIDCLEYIESNEELGLLIRATGKYFLTGKDAPEELEQIKKDRFLKMEYKKLKESIDRNLKAYEEKCKKNSQNIITFWNSEEGKKRRKTQRTYEETDFNNMYANK